MSLYIEDVADASVAPVVSQVDLKGVGEKIVRLKLGNLTQDAEPNSPVLLYTEKSGARIRGISGICYADGDHFCNINSANFYIKSEGKEIHACKSVGGSTPSTTTVWLRLVLSLNPDL